MEQHSDKTQATQLLRRASAADQQAVDALVPLIYEELRRLAKHFMKSERAGHTLQTTALVNEAYLRLIEQRNINPNDRNHFLAVASTVIRRVLVDHARKRNAAKRGGDEGWERVSLAAIDPPASEQAVDILALHEALEKLATISERAAKIVTMRYFGGMTVEQVAAAMDISPRTIAAEWSTARAWLRRELGGDGGEGE